MEMSPQHEPAMMQATPDNLALGGVWQRVDLPERRPSKRKAMEIERVDEEGQVGLEMKKLRIQTFSTTETVAQMRLKKDVDEVLSAAGALTHGFALSINKNVEDPFSVFLTVKTPSRNLNFVLTVPTRYPFIPPKVLVPDAIRLGMQHPLLNVDSTLSLRVLQDDMWTPCLGITNIVDELFQVIQGA